MTVSHDRRPDGGKCLVRPFLPGEERYVADAHRRIYAQEYQWGDAFIRYAMDIALSFGAKARDEGEALWIAEAEGRPVGCVMLCRTEEPLTAQLRLFLVEKEYRGHGAGSALMRALLEKAQASGYRRIILWTAHPLHDAIRLYERMGFRFVEETENRTWRPDGQVVREIKMEKTLA